MRKIGITDEQAMLDATAARFLAERYDFEHREKIRASNEGFDAAIWNEFAEMGWLGLPFDAEQGGSGGSMLDVALLMERFGAALVAEPFIPTVVAAGTAISFGGSPAQRNELIPRIVAGSLRMALAAAERGGGYDLVCPRTHATRTGNHYRLDGGKAVVLGAADAELLVVSARSDNGISLFLIPADAAGVTIRAYPTIDGRRAAELSLVEVQAGQNALLGPEGGGAPILQRAADAATIALLGEASGVVQAAVDRTASHLNAREQFGRPLASFQALRHRIARMYVMKEEVRALCRQAAVAFIDAPDGPETRELIAAAKVHAGREGRRVCEEAIQLHGAIAITDEYIVGHYLKRLIMIDRTFGDARHHLGIFAATARSLAAAPAGS